MRHARGGLLLVAATALLGSCGGGTIGTGGHRDGGGGGDAALRDDAGGTQADAPSCTDGSRNGTETDIDCGGSCQRCDDGFRCLVDGDCGSGHCDAQQCVPAPCVNGSRDGAETDVDCGGGTCAPCEEGQRCGGGPDCLSGVCTGDTCQAPACDDTVRNGQETDVDCGGPVCPKCATGLHCEAAGDCATGNCVALVCARCANESTFSWDAPNTNVDGTCVTDLAGYRLYYGTAPGVYTEVHLVDLTSTACVESGTTNDCGAVMTCTYEVSDLPAGLWYFAMTAYDLEGSESGYSNEVSKTIVCE